ncbi:MAG TPA: hypothetical protein VNC40_02090 [Gaiellaceae bacterium]|nr:hypothetical protein [Gaiellaceae bacterium]
MARAKSLRAALGTLVVAAFVSGGALASSNHVSAPHFGGADGFGSTVPSSAFAGYVAKPLYRERTVATRFRLKRVPCASAAEGDTSLCFAAG